MGNSKYYREGLDSDHPSGIVYTCSGRPRRQVLPLFRYRKGCSIVHRLNDRKIISMLVHKNSDLMSNIKKSKGIYTEGIYFYYLNKYMLELKRNTENILKNTNWVKKV